MKTLTENMTPRCFGRYLVEMPQNFELNTEGGQTIDGVAIDVKLMPQRAFKYFWADKKSKLESTVMIGDERFPFVRKVIPLPDNLEGGVFDRAQSPVSGGRMTRALELWGWKEGFLIHASILAIDTTFPEDADDPVIQKNVKTNISE